MRIKEAWNGLMKENIALKGALFITSILALLMAILVFKFSENAPVVIDRSPMSKVAQVADEELTSLELQQFVKESLAQRFNTESKDYYYLSDLQKVAREKEQTELTRNQMRQFLYIEIVLEDKGSVTIEATRLILVGSIRSAFRFPLKVKLEKVGRTTSNPYGLILTEVQTIKPEGKETNGK